MLASFAEPFRLPNRIVRQMDECDGVHDLGVVPRELSSFVFSAPLEYLRVGCLRIGEKKLGRMIKLPLVVVSENHFPQCRKEMAVTTQPVHVCRIEADHK